MRSNSAIPTERTYPLRMPRDWQPPVPAWSSTFSDADTAVAMAVLGFQHHADVDVIEALGALHDALDGAEARDLVTSDAGGGLHETVCIAYWRSYADARAVLEGSRFLGFWEAQTARGNVGLIKECVNIPHERTETLFSGPEHDHGYSQMREGTVGPIPHHQYWGGMRDRIPRSAHDSLEATEPVRVTKNDDEHVVVEAHENLCIIRSGQDWEHCDPDQWAEYEEHIQPVLEAGMHFLRDRGDEVNCYACRYMRDLNRDGTLAKRSAGMAYFRTLTDLEGWAEHHPTHLKIFNTFLALAPKHGPNLQLRLWHEVSVLPASECRAEYVRCRAGTGWMPR